jgi:tetratricopeptide (TPR) repeat protein
MKKIIYKSNITKLLMLSLVCAMFVAPGCKKALDNNLENGTYDDKFWKTEADVNAGLSGAYSYFRKVLYNGNAFFLWGDFPSGPWQTKDAIDAPLAQGVFTSVPYKVEALINWGDYYKAIAICNLAIENIPKIEDSKFNGGAKGKNYYLGEAHFVRALCYFYMARIWGEVPIQLTAINSADQIAYLRQSPEDKVTEQVLNDARIASSLLTFEGTNTLRRVRANKGAALALLAHTTAWRHEYDKTVLYTDSIINESAYYSLEEAENIRLPFKNSTSKENIFVIPTSKANNEAYTSSGIGFATLAEPVFKNHFDEPLYTIINDSLAGMFPDKIKDVRYAKFFTKMTGMDRTLMIKYADYGLQENGVDFYFESNLIIFRLADMYLLKAEALNNVGRDTEAQQALNVVRYRANTIGSTLGGLELKKEILNERKRELTGEGQLFYDRIRMNLFPNWWNEASDPSVRLALKGWRWPIDNSILSNNNQINQTEYWRGKY